MSLINGIYTTGNWSNIYLSTPKQVEQLRIALKQAGIRISHLIKRSNQIVGLNAKIDENTALTYVNSIKK